MARCFSFEMGFATESAALHIRGPSSNSKSEIMSSIRSAVFELSGADPLSEALRAIGIR